MSIQPALNAAIYTLLSGTGVTNAGTAVYYLQAPDGKALPYIVFDYVNEGDDNDNPHRSKSCVVSIRAYAATPAASGVIDGQIDTAIHRITLTVTGWTNFETKRENGYSMIENVSGTKIYMTGADYRFRNTK